MRKPVAELGAMSDEQLRELCRPDGIITLLPGMLTSGLLRYDEAGKPIDYCCAYCGTLPGKKETCRNCGAPTDRKS